MATLKDAKIAANQPAKTSAQAGQIVVNSGSYECPDPLAVNTLIALAVLPAQHVPVDVILEADALDTGSAMRVSVGVLNSDEDDLVASTNFITVSAIASTGGVARADTVAGLQLAASDSDRVIAVKVTTAATTEAEGTLKLKVLSVPA